MTGKWADVLEKRKRRKKMTRWRTQEKKGEKYNEENWQVIKSASFITLALCAVRSHCSVSFVQCHWTYETKECDTVTATCISAELWLEN
jgi:hypothetical protein